jgi:ATP-binding cassette subfamily B protein
LGAAGFVLAEALLPNAALVAVGRATGYIPAAVADGLGSAAGRRLVVALSIGGVLYALSLLRSPLEDFLATRCSLKLGAFLRQRLVTAVSEPPGIEHLEDPEVLDRLFSATGELLDAQPADAPMLMAGVLGDQLGGLVACIVLSTFRWWVGLVMFLAWSAVRRSMSELGSDRANLRRLEAGTLRRAWYFLGLTWRADSAKEMRIFGVSDWALEGHRNLWFQAMASTWEAMRQIERRAVVSAAAITVAVAVATGDLTWSAYDHRVGLRTLAIMLPMLVVSSQLTSFSIAAQKSLASLPDMDWLVTELHRPGRVESAAMSPAIRSPEREIRFQGVSYRYPGSEADVLHDLDLVLPAGRSLAVVGINGAGKTTLVTLLARLREPTAGSILVDGKPLTIYEVSAWQRNVAVVYQDFGRYPISLRDNVAMFDLAGEVDNQALQMAASKAGLLDVVDGLPRGWDTIASRQFTGGVDLSGGQWQRVALARALYAVERGAGVLILDEPTAHLDVRAEASFYDRFFALTEGVTTVVISHRLPTVRRADRIAVLDGGRISELGTHAELVASGLAYAQLFDRQSHQFSSDDEAG